MSETPPIDPKKEVLKSRLVNAGPNAAPPTRETIITQVSAEKEAEDTIRKAHDALDAWEKQQLASPEQTVIEAAAAKKRQEALQRRQDVIDKYNAGRPADQQIANLNRPKPVASTGQTSK